MTEEEIVKELSKKYNRKENEIKILLNICKKYKYNIYTSKHIIDEFMLSLKKVA